MHKYQFIYNHCDSTFGYDELVEKLCNTHFIDSLNNNCADGFSTLFIQDLLDEEAELVDFLDGNGFMVDYPGREVGRIIPIEKENVK